jgi:hypothetical protein
MMLCILLRVDRGVKFDRMKPKFMNKEEMT